MWSWLARKRWAAAAMEDGSLPTLKAMTARTVSAMPCWVTHSSVTAASRIARVRNDVLRRIGSTHAPWPVTILNGRVLSPVAFCLPPEISMASLGDGTLYPSIVEHLSIRPAAPCGVESRQQSVQRTAQRSGRRRRVGREDSERVRPGHHVEGAGAV